MSSSPGRPTIELSSRMLGTDMQDGVTDEINLKWLVPQDDGGFPITGKDVLVYKPRIVFVVTQVIEHENRVIFFSNRRLIHEV